MDLPSSSPDQSRRFVHQLANFHLRRHLRHSGEIKMLHSSRESKTRLEFSSRVVSPTRCLLEALVDVRALARLCTQLAQFGGI